MFQFMLVVGLVLAYYGYAVTKNPRIWGDQGRDAIKEENWNRYVRYNGQFAMYAGFLMAALDALDMAVDLSAAIYLLILLGGLAILLYPFAHWMHENEGTWNPWPRVETEKQKRKRLIKEQERQEKKNKKKYFKAYAAKAKFGSKTVKVTFKNVTGYASYKVQMKAGKAAYKTVKTTTKGGTITYTKKKAKVGTTYKFSLKGINKVNGKTVSVTIK